MIFKIIRAENLPAADVSGTSDPFVKITYDGKEIATTPKVKRNLNPRWDFETTITLTHTSWLYVVLEIWDRDELSTNDLLGALRVPFPDWRSHLQEYQNRLQAMRQKINAQHKSNQIRQLQHFQTTDERMLSSSSGDTMDLALKLRGSNAIDHQRRSRSLNSCGIIQRTAQQEELERSFASTSSTATSSISSNLKGGLMDPIKPVLIWSNLVKGNIAQGRVLCSILYEERDFKYFANRPYGTNIQDVFLPQNPRFEQIYCHLPRSWHPDLAVRQDELSAMQKGTPKDCLFPWYETLLYMVEEVTVTFHVNESNQGVLATLVLTNYRIWFVPYRRVKGLVHEDVHTIPVANILKASISQQKRSNNNMVTMLVLECMDAGHYNVTLSPISRLRDSVRDFSREAEAKRIKQLHNIVAEIEWLQIENTFCAPLDLNHSVATIEEEQLEEDLRYYAPKHGGFSSRHPAIGRAMTIPRNEFQRTNAFAGLADNGVIKPNKPGDRIILDTNVPNHYPILQHHMTAIPNFHFQEHKRTPRVLGGKRRIRYDAPEEYRRQGAFNHPKWRYCSLNENYEICASYPAFLMVPSALMDDIIHEASRFRSKNRFPVLSWLHPRTGAPLCRSSQPNTGVLRSTNAYDKALIWAIRDAAIPAELCRKSLQAQPKKSCVLHIVDCRPEINAKSNALAGKGHESVKQYDRDGVATAFITFMGIDNIHVVRNSFAGLAQALYEVEDSNFFGAVQKSRWLEHVCGILQGACEVALHLERGDPVLVHCSDGWDRTAQLSALAQVMLDPYYRTLEGFAILIEKDWCSFGHMFKKRCGHPTSDQTSPIFPQFLDAVYQLTLQFPTHFQFNELFLSTIAEAVYSSWYGTFQMNSEKERRQFLENIPSTSVWDVIRASTDQYLNPLFAGGEINATRMEPMLPVCRVRLMQLWSGQYQKAISHMRLQQREFEMLLLIRQQESELSKLYAIITPNQQLQLRANQLRSDISGLARSMNLDYPDSHGRFSGSSENGVSSASGRDSDKRTTSQSVDFHDLTSMTFPPAETAAMGKTPEQENAATVAAAVASTSSNGALSQNNVPNARRRKSLTNRSRSNSIKMSLLSMMGASHDKSNTLSSSSHHDNAPASSRQASAVSTSSNINSPSRQNSQREHDDLKSEIHRLEEQLGKLNHQIGLKEDMANQTLRRFRCYNYNLPESAMQNEQDVFSPTPRGRNRQSTSKSERFHSPSLASPSSSSSQESSPSSTYGISRNNSPTLDRSAVNFTPGSAPLLTTDKIVSNAGSFRTSQPVWERDGDAPCCKRCKKKFKAVYRNRHHCRCCGYVFCGRCTSNRMNLPEFGYYDVVRVCVQCYNSGEDG